MYGVIVPVEIKYFFQFVIAYLPQSTPKVTKHTDTKKSDLEKKI